MTGIWKCCITSELWGFFCEEFEENWCCNGTLALHSISPEFSFDYREERGEEGGGVWGGGRWHGLRSLRLNTSSISARVWPGYRKRADMCDVYQQQKNEIKHKKIWKRTGCCLFSSCTITSSNLIWVSLVQQLVIYPYTAVLWKMQNPGSPNRPSMVYGWVVCLRSG